MSVHVKKTQEFTWFIAMQPLVKIPNVSFLFSPAAPCSGNTYFCHSNMCINNSLVCNGIQNCAYPWDENHCRGEDGARLAPVSRAGLSRMDRKVFFLEMC